MLLVLLVLFPKEFFHLLPDGLLTILVERLELLLPLLELSCALLDLRQFPLQFHSFEVKNSFEMIRDRFLEFQTKGLLFFLLSIMEFPDDAVSNQLVAVNGNKGLRRLPTNVFEQDVKFTNHLSGGLP